MTIAIIQNAALLLALALLYDVVVLSRTSAGTSRVRTTVLDAITGVALGSIGVAVMASSWEVRDGVILDTRSVVLGLVGLFFGAVPVALAIIVTAVYRLSQGGDGALTGVAVIVASGVIGLAARHLRPADAASLRPGPMRPHELIAVGLAVHVGMLVAFVAVPFDGSRDVVRDIAPAVLVIYTTAFVLLGLLLVRRRREVDVTRQLAESEERYRSVFDNDHMAVMVIDPGDGRIVEVNQRAVDYYGWSRDELLSMRSSDLEVLPREEVLRQIDDGIAAGRSSFEFQHRLASGEVRDVEVIGGAVTIDGKLFVHVVINDVTERAQAQRDLLVAQDQLRHAQRVEAVGRLAGGVAHDFNNMLQVILGYAELLEAELDPTSELHGYVAEINDAAGRSADLTRQLLAFARRQTASPQLVDVGDALDRSLQMLGRLVGEHISVTLDVPDDLWSVRVDPAQLGQVFANLAINARDAIGDAGTVRFEAANVIADEDRRGDTVGHTDEYVEIAVTDDGHGMSPEVVASVFEPFFSTRGPDGGTGLGLAIVYGVVTQHGGFVQVESEPSVGSTFRLYLPRAVASDDDDPLEWAESTRAVAAAAQGAPAAEPNADGRATLDPPG